jgi:nucleoside-diphosphate-sugar epimerase
MYGVRFGWSLAGHDGYELIREDLQNPAVLREAVRDVDAVVHLAAIVGDPACARQPSLARAVNLDGSLALLDAARAAGVKHSIFASTCSNYGRLAEDSRPATEDFPLRPLSLYAETKVQVEQALLANPVEAMSITVLRFATLYGLSPRMRFDLTVNEFTLGLCRNHNLVVYGQTFWRPYVHVQDAAHAVMAVLHADPGAVRGKVFNVGSDGENYRKLDLVNLITDRMGAGDVQYVHKAEDPRDYKVSFERIRLVLGFAGRKTVKDGIDEVFAAFRAGLIEEPYSTLYSNTPAAA